MKKIAVVGAGISGLTLAKILKDDAHVTIFEKSRGVGGRVSTRREDPFIFDHGAQYFTVKTEAFDDFIQPLIADGIVKRWNARFVTMDARNKKESSCQDGLARYVGVPNMNDIGKYIAKDSSIKLRTKISSLVKGGKWKLNDEQCMSYDDFDWVVFSVPPKQAECLLPDSINFYSEIKSVIMRPCFALMLGFSDSLSLNFEAAQINNSDVRWISINSKKPDRKSFFSLVIHSSNEFAEKHIDDSFENIMQHLLSETSNILGKDVSFAEHKKIHLWRYAQRSNCDKLTLYVDYDLNIALCGDWCDGDRVECAFTSAYKLAQEIKGAFL